MQLTISKEMISAGIQLVQNAVSQKSSLPILSNVLMEAENKELRLTATDLDIGICATIPANIEQAGSITIPAKKFFDVVRSLPDGSDIELVMKRSNFVNINCGPAKIKIIGLPKEEFPELPEFKDKDAIIMEQPVLKEMLNLIDFAISRDDTRYVLNGTLFVIKGGAVEMVATDGRRLAVHRKDLGKKTLVDREVIVPTKAVMEVKRMLQDEGEVEIKFSDSQVMFSFPDCFVLSRTIEGEYPNYEKVIPKESDKKLTVSREDLLQAARRADIFTDQDSMAVKLTVTPKKLVISKNTPYLGEAKEEMKASYNGDELQIGFNPRYLIDVLRNLDSEEIVFELEDAQKPGVIRKGDEYVYVVLPMQLAG